MALAIEVLDWVSAGCALWLAGVAGLRARRVGPPGRWVAASFAALAAVLVVAALAGQGAPGWVDKALVCVLLAFPFLLLRFTASLGAVPGRYVRVAAASTAVMLVASVVLPSLPEDGAARPAWSLV